MFFIQFVKNGKLIHSNYYTLYYASVLSGTESELERSISETPD